MPSSFSIWVRAAVPTSRSRAAALADDDALLAVPLDVEHRVHVDQIVAVRPRVDLLDHHRQRVRQLVAHPLQRGLADQLGHQHLLGLVGQLAVRVERRAGGQLRGQHVDRARRPAPRWSPTPARSRRGVPTSSLTATSCRGHLLLGHLVDLGDDARRAWSSARRPGSARRSTGRRARSPRRPGCTARSRRPRSRCRAPGR